jgi:hypothetical protein
MYIINTFFFLLDFVLKQIDCNLQITILMKNNQWSEKMIGKHI